MKIIRIVKGDHESTISIQQKIYLENGSRRSFRLQSFTGFIGVRLPILWWNSPNNMPQLILIYTVSL